MQPSVGFDAIYEPNGIFPIDDYGRTLNHSPVIDGLKTGIVSNKNKHLNLTIFFFISLFLYLTFYSN